MIDIPDKAIIYLGNVSAWGLLCLYDDFVLAELNTSSLSIQKIEKAKENEVTLQNLREYIFQKLIH